MRALRPLLSRPSLATLAAKLRDRRGVAALEFALIAPIMILMFFGISELGQGLLAERRVSHATSTLGDLAAQLQNVAQSDANDMFAASADIMAPLNAAPLNLRISSVTVNSKGMPKVDWSYNQGMAKLSDCDNPPTLPTGLVTSPGDTIILSESQYKFTSPIGYLLPNGITFSRSSYLRPRYGVVTRLSPAQASCG